MHSLTQNQDRAFSVVTTDLPHLMKESALAGIWVEQSLYRHLRAPTFLIVKKYFHFSDSYMDEVVKKVAALGLPGVILVMTMAATGLTGAAAITAALAFLGGPAGMLGGIAVLGLTGLITDALAKVGLEDFLTAVYCERRQEEPHGKLLNEIEELSLFDGDIKERLKATVTDGCGCSTVVNSHVTDVTKEAIAILDSVPGMTRAHHRDFKSSNPIIRLRDGTAVRTWKNPVGVDHVFLADSNDRMVYGGYVGWIHSEGLNEALARIRRDFT